MMTAAGTMACERVRDALAIVRNIIDMVMTVTKEISRKKKKAPASRRRFVMKYSVTLKTMQFMILYGMSQSMDATASADG